MIKQNKRSLNIKPNKATLRGEKKEIIEKKSK